MYLLVSVLVMIVCVLMILIVLVQNSKGGGLASNFQSSNQFMGVRKTTDFLEKSTWTLAIALMAFCVIGSLSIPRGSATERSRLEDQIETVIDPNAIPTFPSPEPDQGDNPDMGGNLDLGGNPDAQ